MFRGQVKKQPYPSQSKKEVRPARKVKGNIGLKLRTSRKGYYGSIVDM
jgi:hypothetical protein